MSEKAKEIIFLQWKRSGGEVVRLVAQEYKGKYFVHLRIFYLDKHGKLKPSQRGVTIPDEQLAQLRKALRKAKKELTADTKPVDQSIKRKKKWPPT